MGERRNEAPVDDLEAVRSWRRWLRARDLSERTISSYTSAASRFLFWTERSLSEIDEDDMARFLSTVGANGPAGRRMYLRALKSLFGYLHRRDHVGEDPCAEIRMRKPKGRPQVALSYDELRRLVFAASIREERRGWALLLSFSLGLRRGELAGLRPRDDLGDAVYVQGKGGKRRRVEVGPVARHVLDALQPCYNGTVLGGIKPGTLTRWALQAAEDCGFREKVRGRTHHVLRASFASHLLRGGANPTAVRDLLGHESLATTSVYAFAWEEDRREAVGRL